MINFPKIKPPEVALLRINTFTGHLLDSDFLPCPNFRITRGAEVYSVFGSLDIAKAYIEENKSDYPNAEYCVYDFAEKIVFTYQPTQTSDLPQRDLGEKFLVYPKDDNLRDKLSEILATFEESLKYIDEQQRIYPYTQFKIRDANVIHTVKAKKGIWAIFRKVWA